MLPIKTELPKCFLEEETRNNYRISRTMKAIWAVEIDLYKELERACMELGLKVFCDGGTLLGAIRHNGFIPWDDDMDFGMSRDDYEILCAHAKEVFSFPYYWETEDTDPGTARGHGQLRNSLTTGILKNELNGKCKFNQGIFIDVFPYDNVPDNIDSRASFLKKINDLNIKKSRYRNYFLGINSSYGIKHLVKTIVLPVFRLFHKHYNNKAYVELEELKKRYKNIETKKWANLHRVFLNNIDRLVFDKSRFQTTIHVQFEFITVPVIEEYDYYLSQVYGEWKEFVIGPSIHGGTILDPYKPYTDYIC